MAKDKSSAEVRKMNELLRIPAKDWPPDHYSILGLKSQDANLHEINNAALRLSSLLRRSETLENKDRARAVLRQISLAQECLLDTDAKARYDRGLRQGKKTEIH